MNSTEACEWYEANFPDSGREAILFGASMISSRSAPGPFYRKQLFTLLAVWHKQGHPMGWQKSLQDAGRAGYLASVGPGDYLALPGLYDWIDTCYPGAPQAYEPVPRARFHWRTLGQLPGNDDVGYEAQYRCGRLASLAVTVPGAKRSFRGWKPARRWLIERGRWILSKEDDESAENVFERYVFSYAL